MADLELLVPLVCGIGPDHCHFPFGVGQRPLPNLSGSRLVENPPTLPDLCRDRGQPWLSGRGADSLPTMGEPSPALRSIFRAPSWLYRRRLGWLLGKRFLEVTHRGRKSGNVYQTVLEVIKHDPITEESVVVSAYGSGADWYRNLEEEAAIRVRTGRRDYIPEQRFLSKAEAHDTAAEFCGRHRLEAKLMPRVLSAIGADGPAEVSHPVEFLARLPMVAFRPKG